MSTRAAILLAFGQLLLACGSDVPSDPPTDAGISADVTPDPLDAGTDGQSTKPDASHGADAMQGHDADARVIGSDAAGTDHPDAAPPDGIYPADTWVVRSPGQASMDEGRLEQFRSAVDGRGVVVRGGTIVYSWGDISTRADIASAAKPFYAHMLYLAVQEGRLSNLDARANAFEPRLNLINASLGYKDQQITFRHLATQTSGYGVRESPGEAFDYNDWQMALFVDTLFLKVYQLSWSQVDSELFRTKLCDAIQCEDDPTFLAFGSGDRPGRVAVSVRDHARFGLLYLRKGWWAQHAVLPEGLVDQAVGSPVANSVPRTAAQVAEMIPGQRSIGSQEVPDDQSDHLGSYSYLWWTNGVDRNGNRHWPGAPLDTYMAAGHGGKRVMLVIPSLDLVAAWNDSPISDDDAMNTALGFLASAVQGPEP